MRIRTVMELRSYLEENAISPEILAKKVNVSNMTIRRLLQKPDATVIAAKYQDNFDQNLRNGIRNDTFQDFDAFLLELEKDGEKITNSKEVVRQTQEKMKTKTMGPTLIGLAKELIGALGSKNISKKRKAMVLGALLYFINPIDLIPDHIPVVGYLDDFAVMTLAVAAIKSDLKKEAEKAV